MSGLTIQAWNADNALYGTTQSAKAQEKDGRQAVFGGSLSMGEDRIAQRRRQAQQQAWKVVQDAWGTDRSIDDAIQAKRDHYADMERLRDEAYGRIKDIGEDEKALQMLYGVADDSQEQKDLELLRKEQDAQNHVPGYTELTDEERERLAEIHKKGLTEYQERALNLNDAKGYWKKEFETAKRWMASDTENIRRIERERPENQPMIEAQKTAQEILDAANKEIKGMVVQDAVDHVDEKMEEVEEKLDEAAEKQEEREEQLEEQKLQRAIQRAMIEGTKEAVEEAKEQAQRGDTPDLDMTDMVEMMRGGEMVKDVGQSLNDIKSNMRVLEADLKGIKVDEEI